MIFNWDVCGVVCICFVYAAAAYADYVTIIWLVQPTFDGSLWAVVHTCIFNVLLFMMCLAHGRSMLTDPGIVPISRARTQPDTREHVRQGNQQSGDRMYHQRATMVSSDSEGESQLLPPPSRLPPGDYVGEDWTICGRCDSYRPPRAHHCRICKRCVRKMDHHCPWINNCVGEFNQKYFIQFLFYVGVSSLYCLAMVACAWTWPCDQGKQALCQPYPFNSPLHHAKVLHSIFVSIECALFCLFVVAVSCDQMQAVLTDETAVEQVQRRRSAPTKTRRSKRSLMRDVCGDGPYICWLLPCHDLPTRKDYVHLPVPNV